MAPALVPVNALCRSVSASQKSRWASMVLLTAITWARLSASRLNTWALPWRIRGMRWSMDTYQLWWKVTLRYPVSSAAVAAWMIMKNRQVEVFRPAAKLGAWVILISAVLVSISGDMDMKVMVQQQPMKVAAAEALYQTQENAPFSILSVGDLSGDTATTIIEIPGLLSYLATGTFNGPESTVQGINDLQAQYLAEFPQYGPEMNFVPYVPVTYWGFRLMIGLGMLAALYALLVLFLFRGGRTPKSRLFAVFNGVIVLFPLFGISAGLTKATVEQLDDGVLAILEHWHLYALIVVGYLSMTLSEAALQTGERSLQVESASMAVLQAETAVAQAEVIIDAGVQSFMHWVDQRGTVPLIQQLNAQADEWRAAEITRARKLLAKGRHRRIPGDAALCDDFNQHQIGVMPGVAGRVVRRGGIDAVPLGRLPVRFSFAISPVATGARGLIDLCT